MRLALQMDWAGENEFGVYFYHPANETIPEERRIQPKVQSRSHPEGSAVLVCHSSHTVMSCHAILAVESHFMSIC